MLEVKKLSVTYNGNIKALKGINLHVNHGEIVVLIGAMAKTTDIEKDIWVEALKQCVPAKFLDVNLKAFELGYNS